MLQTYQTNSTRSKHLNFGIHRSSNHLRLQFQFYPKVKYTINTSLGKTLKFLNHKSSHLLKTLSCNLHKIIKTVYMDNQWCLTLMILECQCLQRWEHLLLWKWENLIMTLELKTKCLKLLLKVRLMIQVSLMLNQKYISLKVKLILSLDLLRVLLLQKILTFNIWIRINLHRANQLW